MRYTLFGLCVALLGFAVVACGGGDGNGNGSDAANAGDAVAVVNGEEISRAELDIQLEQLEAGYEQQGLPFPENEELEQLKLQIVNQLVVQTLVLQEAEARDITASAEEVEAQYAATAARFPDEESFEQALADEGLDQARLEQLIADNIRIEKVVQAVLAEAQVARPTEEELRLLYDVVSEQQELPPFEEVADQLEAEFMNQRENEVIENFLLDLETRSDIEIRLG